eukprot:3426668-Rhodomonas_salina.1
MGASTVTSSSSVPSTSARYVLRTCLLSNIALAHCAASLLRQHSNTCQREERRQELDARGLHERFGAHPGGAKVQSVRESCVFLDARKRVNQLLDRDLTAKEGKLRELSLRYQQGRCRGVETSVQERAQVYLKVAIHPNARRLVYHQNSAPSIQDLETTR